MKLPVSKTLLDISLVKVSFSSIWSMKERNIGIDILKFIAILMITNTHLKSLYVDFSFLSTGGAIGNALFFFCSGFTLFMKPFSNIKDFPDWYKRRINRIYPSVFAVSIVLCTFTVLKYDINTVILHGGQWFVTVIMVYYVFLYLIGLYLRERIDWVLGIVVVALFVWFYMTDFPPYFNLFGNDYIRYKWILYFVFMLFGARVGMMSHEKQSKPQWRNLLLALLGLAFFYVLLGVTTGQQQFAPLHVFTVFPMLMALYFLYLWANGKWARSVYNTKWGNLVIRFIGGMCLEIYLIQNILITRKLNFLFPLNIPIVLCEIIVGAYLLRCMARFISQTFKEAPYDWKKMVDIY